MLQPDLREHQVFLHFWTAQEPGAPAHRAAAKRMRPATSSWTSAAVGAENSVTSCELHVFVDEAAEPVSS